LDDQFERVRLPGLFRWQEVCDVFDLEAGHDGEWHFEVRRTSDESAQEALYVVYAVAPKPAPRE
jgi:hypothetical protein